MGEQLKQKAGPAGLVMALAALVTAIGGLMQPRDDTMTRATYEVLAGSVEQLRVDIAHNRSQLEWMRDTFARPQPAQTAAPSSTPSSSATVAPSSAPTVPPSATAVASASATVLAPPPPPPAHPRPHHGGASTRRGQFAGELPTFDDLEQSVAR